MKERKKDQERTKERWMDKTKITEQGERKEGKNKEKIKGREERGKE